MNAQPFFNLSSKAWRTVGLALIIALASSFVSEHYGGPIMLYALLFGMAFNFLGEDGDCKQGIDFSSNVLLKAGVALLGLRLSFNQIADIGWLPFIAVGTGLVVTIGAGYVMARVLGLKTKFALLSGGAVAICGASAAMAIASVMPKYKDLERDTILTVAVVTGLSTLAMIAYPLVTFWFGFDIFQTSMFLGGTIHDVAQVVGAGHMVSDQVAEQATYIKLCRVTLLSPVIAVILLMKKQMTSGREGNVTKGSTATALSSKQITPHTRNTKLEPFETAYGHSETARERTFEKPSGFSFASALTNIPFFLIAFFGFLILNSVWALPVGIHSGLVGLSKWLLVIAIASIGMKTSLKQVAKAGWRPFLLMVFQTIVLATVIFSFCLI